MKKVSFLSLILFFIFILALLPIKDRQYQPSVKDNKNEPFSCDTFEEWREFLLTHNNMSTEDLKHLPPGAISSINRQARIYQGWSNGTYTNDEKKILLYHILNTPIIRYRAPENHPLEGIDLKSYTDEFFELDFKIYDMNVNEWILRVYAYLDYDVTDTNLSLSDKFIDGSDFKHYNPGEKPTSDELNPDMDFMGEDLTEILEDFTEWTSAIRDYTAKKMQIGRIDDEIYFHAKILYKIDNYEVDGWHSYYYYKNFYLSWFWDKNFKVSILKIIDDDVNPPIINNINLLNSPIYENDEFIDIEINANDKSGISDLYIDFKGITYRDNNDDNIITIPNPGIQGEYEFYVTAIDADLDREGDQLSTTIPYNFEVLDDDTEGPIISEINIMNSLIYDSDDLIDIEIIVDDISGISDLYIDFMGNIFRNNEGKNEITIPNPHTPGEYEFSVIAVDDDSEFEDDKSSTTEYFTFQVFDDDTTAPNIFILEDENGWNISIIDNDGVEDSIASAKYIIMDQNDEVIDSGIIPEENKIYTVLLPLKLGIYTLIVNSTNNDLEWDDDEETSAIITQSNIKLAYCYWYVIQLIEDLKAYIKDNLCRVIACCLVFKLTLTQKCLMQAYELKESGKITCGIWYDTMALKLIAITECMAKFFHCISLISHDDAEYIISSLHIIGEYIVFLMEYSLDYL